MKKVSISLFAILAICFAVSSAFTTTVVKKQALLEYQVYGVEPEAIEGDESSPNSVNSEDVINQGSFIDEFESQQGLSSGQFAGLCDPDPDFVCLAQFRASDGVVVSIREGAYNE